MWTVYEKPSDYPNSYVARRFVNEQPLAEVIVSGTLADIRRQMIHMGLTCLQRDPGDEPQIVEVWL